MSHKATEVSISPRRLFIPELGLLGGLATPGSFSLVWSEEQVAWVGKGSSILNSLSRNISLLEAGQHPCRKIQELYQKKKPWYQVLAGPPEECYRTEVHHLEGYKYEVLSPPPPSWRVREIAVANPINNGRGFLVLAVLRNKAGREILSGAFKTVAEARDFTAAAYPDPNRVYEPKINDDEVTKQVAAMGRVW